jgi:hypothetical protein
VSAKRPSTVKRTRRTRAELHTVDEAIVSAAAEQHPISLRGLYYRVLSAGVIPKSEASYRLVGRQLLKLRRGGEVPYSWVVDGTRLSLKVRTYDGLTDVLNDTAAVYRRALWRNQRSEVIFLSEKDAIRGTVMPVLDEFDVALDVVRGYSSLTMVYDIATVVRANTVRGKHTFLYQLGDHDPSGVGAWRTLERQVREFAPGAQVTFERIAVTPEQIETYELLTRPTKRNDPRARWFVEEFRHIRGGESVEVDALPPNVLRDLVRAAIEQHIDPEALRQTKLAERSERELLHRIAGTSPGLLISALNTMDVLR